MIGTWLFRARLLAAPCGLGTLLACGTAAPGHSAPVERKTTSTGGAAGAPGAGGAGGLDGSSTLATSTGGSGGAPSCADPPLGPGGAASSGFQTREGLDDGMLARAVGEEFSVSSGRLRVGASGESWVLWRSHSDPDALTGTTHLDHFDAAGRWRFSSALEVEAPTDFVLHDSGALSAWRLQCGEDSRGICFYRDLPPGPVSEASWEFEPQPLTRYLLDEQGNLIGEEQSESSSRVVLGASAAGEGLSVVTREGEARLYHLRSDFSPAESVELLPAVVAPLPDPDAPLEEILQLLPLTQQSLTAPVRTRDAVIVAAAITSPSFAALEQAQGVDLPRPNDRRCADVVVMRVPDAGSRPDYHVIPSAECESHPLLTIVGERAIVASLVPVKQAGPSNDTEHYDISLGILDLAGRAPLVTLKLGWAEDDWAHAIAPCGDEHVCIAGTTGARSVDTGSVVSYGDGFIQRLSLLGEAAGHFTVKSPRHTSLWQLAAASACSLRFFATANGPITHTADNDPSLAFNEGLLGVLTLPDAR